MTGRLRNVRVWAAFAAVARVRERNGQPEYDVLVAPGADLADMSTRAEDAERVPVAPDLPWSWRPRAARSAGHRRWRGRRPRPDGGRFPAGSRSGTARATAHKEAGTGLALDSHDPASDGGRLDLLGELPHHAGGTAADPFRTGRPRWRSRPAFGSPAPGAGRSSGRRSTAPAPTRRPTTWSSTRPDGPVSPGPLPRVTRRRPTGSSAPGSTAGARPQGAWSERARVPARSQPRSSLRMVPTAWPSAIVAFVGDDRFTVKVSSGSAR